MCVVHQVHVYIHSHMYNIEIEGKVGKDRSTSYNTLLKDPVITDGAVNTIPEGFLRKWWKSNISCPIVILNIEDFP